MREALQICWGPQIDIVSAPFDGASISFTTEYTEKTPSELEIPFRVFSVFRGSLCQIGEACLFYD
jgi:hypothetical protein